MSKMVNLIEPCYEQLEKLKEEIKEGKIACGEKEKTTYSEIICMLLKYYKNPTMSYAVPSRNQSLLDELKLFAQKNNFKLEFSGIENNVVKVPLNIEIDEDLFLKLDEEFYRECEEDMKNQKQEA
ncbi:MAG TPA: hypothetical protein VN368_01995 [Candidatus Methylomirabilis sp.]|nr:hypothetical protein [Candidatus Methylomirabilis sp.]